MREMMLAGVALVVFATVLFLACCAIFVLFGN